LTALTALSANDPVFQPGFEEADTSIQAAVPMYGVYDLLDRAGNSPAQQEPFLTRIVIGASLQDAHKVWDKGSPLSWIREDAPPIFVIHGGIDTFTDPGQATAFAAALRQVSKNPVAYAELPGAQHLFDALPSVRTAATVAAIDEFVSSVRAGVTTGDRS
jgi:acetyl esterase/lipase